MSDLPHPNPLPRGGGRRIAASIALATLLVSACARPGPAPPPVLPPQSDADLVAHVQARDAAIRTLRARFSATVRGPDTERSIGGVVALAKPHQLRFRLLLSPLGLTILDYLRSGDAAWLTLPLGGDDRALAYASETLPWTFSRLSSDQPWRQCRPWRRRDAVLDVRCGDDAAAPERIISIRVRDGAVEREEWIDGQFPSGRAAVLYADYRTVDGAYLPFRIDIEDPRSAAHTVEVTIDRYEVNPHLAAALFAPPAGARRLPLPVSRRPSSRAGA